MPNSTPAPDYKIMIERSLELGVLLQAIRKLHDPAEESDGMDHIGINTLLEVADRVHTDLDREVVHAHEAYHGRLRTQSEPAASGAGPG